MTTANGSLRGQIKAQIKKIDDEIARLKQKRELLQEMWEEAPAPETRDQVEAQHGPKEAILHLVCEHPRKFTEPTIIAQLRGQVRTKAKDVRKTLSSTLYNMRKKGLIERDEEGQHALTHAGQDVLNSLS
ncbi:MAG: hypothetical protein KAV82_03705 [Phycisphaerae bacterium]|nr:hypothetical protein [Phycisphaerae bacterium]